MAIRDRRVLSHHLPGHQHRLANYLVVLEGAWLKTKRPLYRALFFFWAKIFAVGFAMGVVSAVVMSYEFGTKWSGFSNAAGRVTGPPPTRAVIAMPTGTALSAVIEVPP